MSAFDPKRTSATFSSAAHARVICVLQKNYVALSAISPELNQYENVHGGSEALTTWNNAMTNITMGLEQTEQKILALEVSDEALETAAGTAKEKVNFTLGSCTGLSECPG
jgi:hypothetical protein